MIKIVGDCNFADGFFDSGYGIGSRIKKGMNPFRHIKSSSDDFWIGNFECVCSDVSNKTGIEARQFIIHPDACKNVSHCDLYGVANNHVMQHGEEAYRHLLDYLDANGISHVGDLDHKCVTFSHQNKQIGVMAFSQRPDNFSKNPRYWCLPEYQDVINEYEKIKACDFKIVFVHWGNEFMNRPYTDQIQFAHFLVASGFDLVVGMHPHILQGYEIYQGKHIFYSIGNCVFNMAWEPAKYAMMVNVDFNKENIVSYEYLHIDEDFSPRYVQSVPSDYTMEHLNALLNKTIDQETYYYRLFKRKKKYKKANRKNIIKKLYKLKPTVVYELLVNFLKRKGYFRQ